MWLIMCSFCKPLDGKLIRQLVKNHPAIITVEEGSIGGFGSHGQPTPTCQRPMYIFHALACTR